MGSAVPHESLIQHVELLLESYRFHTGRALLTSSLSGRELEEAVFSAPFALVSHGIEAVPVFNYGNRTALELFAMSWDELTQLESRYSVEQPNREERARLLDEVTCNGYIDNYSGVRISKDGRRFFIENAVVWNVVDAEGIYRGQAATFDRWRNLSNSRPSPTSS